MRKLSLLCRAGAFCSFFLFISLMFVASGHTQSGDPLLFEPYTHYADKEPLVALLTDFTRAQGLRAFFTPSVEGNISGRFEKTDPYTFLEGMRSAFGVGWYKLGDALYFYHESEVIRRFVRPRAVSAAKLQSMLLDGSVLAFSLPGEVMPDGDMLVLTGPPQYVEQAMEAIHSFEEAQLNNTIMRVFPLKYAWAEDIVIDSMGKTTTIPGIASILRSMVSGQSESASKVVQQPATVKKLKGTGLAAVGKSGEQETSTAIAAPASNIMADPRVNAVLITDAEYRMDYYAQVIKALDKPVDLVEIHAAIVDLDTNFKQELGIQWQGAKNNDSGWSGGGDMSTSKNQYTSLGTPGAAAGNGLTLSTVYTMGSDYFLAQIQALEEDGDARVLGRPSVLTVDNIQATLENTSSYYVKVSGENDVDLFKVESGTILKVTPHIIREADGTSSIKLVVNVQDNQDNDTNSGNSTSADGVPIIRQTKINTQAVIGEGQSLLIGGYYYERKTNTENGVPGLMHIPLLGRLFKTTGEESRQMERLILITPRVIRLNELPAPPPRAKMEDFRQGPASFETRPIPLKTSGGGCMRNTATTETVSRP